eukprot:Em0019g732a
MDEQWFFNYSTCKYYGACKDVHPTVHYSSASAVLVLVSAMMVFFMKGGFLLVEISFAKTKRDRKIVVTTFTFAASAATIVGGGLVTNRYKLRLPAAFISAFVVGCGLFGLVVCLFAKFHDRQSKKAGGSCWLWPVQGSVRDYEEGEKPNGFWEWMYPVNAEENELVWDGSLGVIILWFGWFAFNCASSDSVETGTSLINLSKDPFYGIPATIAVNMIMAAAGAGLVATIIAAWAQIPVNANEVGNGLLAALVAITAGCPFVGYWGACLIGALAVVVYHAGCWLEYILGIKDTAKVVPIHALCGLWGLIGTGLFTVTSTSECNLHEAFEGLCYCTLRLPPMVPLPPPLTKEDLKVEVPSANSTAIQTPPVSPKPVTSACRYNWNTCPKDVVHDVRYNDASAAWVLIAAIIVFFMKAGFMLVEQGVGPRSFFQCIKPASLVFKFTFASNAATVVGGCLVTNTYKLRLPAAFISAFVISGIIHPIIVLIIWSDVSQSISPYRFCVGMLPDYNCTLAAPSFLKSMYVLDFAGSGAVHMLGGTFGLVLCLFAKLEEWRQRRKNATGVQKGTEGGEEVHSEGFWDWMYPVSGGDEAVSEAALGVIILWFAWFAFNCGSTESVETPNPTSSGSQQDPYYNIPAIIAINKIMAAASGGIIAILIATWAQGSVLAVLVLVAGWIINLTARLCLCGLWGLIGTGLLVAGPESECNLHATFEGLCYCELRLPPAGQGERILAQILGSLIIFGIGLVSSVLLYGALYVIPINPFVWVMSK